MKRIFWAALLTNLLLSSTQAQVAKGLELAPDELYWKSKATTGSIETTAAAATPGQTLIQARSSSRAKDAQSRLVFYETDKPRTKYTRRILSSDFVVTLQGGANADAIANALGAENLGQINLPGNRYRFRLIDYSTVLDLESRADEFVEILAIEHQYARLQERRLNADDPYLTEQWHLHDPDAEILDINLGDLWETYSGAGVVIGIVDDSLQLTHPDLLPNLVPLHYDFRDGDSDPSPNLVIPDNDDGSTTDEDRHGTAVAGLAAARGNNGIGVSGVAPEAGLVGLRLIGDYSEDVTEASAFLHELQSIDIKNNSWGPPGFGDILRQPDPLSLDALRYATEVGRGGLGTIFVWSAGNGGYRDDDSNKDGYSSSPYTISVGSVNQSGSHAEYSESGASLLICAPAPLGAPRLVTTDLVGDDGYNHSALASELDDRDYTKSFSGTSGAAPIISGVVALMLEANPNLNWRDVQEILMRTARQVEANDPGWFDNDAAEPFHFHQDFGAGLVDALAAVTLAETWTSLGARKSLSKNSELLNLPTTLPDDGSAYEGTFTMPDAGMRVEHASLRLSISHASRGQLDVYLISPSGTESLVLTANERDSETDILDFSFHSIQFWGEAAAGQWTMRIIDRVSGDVGELTQATLTLYGTATGALPAAPQGLAMTRVSGISALLSWEDIADNETGYRIERAADVNGTWTLVTMTGPDVNKFYDESLDGNLYYAYRVCAVGSGVQSAYSEPVESYRAYLETTELYHANFETDQDYSTGGLAGQNGWIAANSVTAVVVNDSSMSGERAVKVGGGSYQGTAYDSVYGSSVYFSEDNAQARVTFQIEINASNAFHAKDSFGVAFYNLSGSFLFALDFDAQSRELSYYNDDYVLHEIGQTFTRNRVYEAELLINMSNNKWSVALDGNLVGSNLPVARSANALNGLAYHEFYWFITNSNSPGNNYMLVDEYRLEMVATDSPAAPTELEGFAQGSNVVFLYWADPFLASHYYVEGRKVGDSEWSEFLDFPVEDWPLPVTVKGLEPKTAYEFRVRAENSFGFSSYSNTLTLESLLLYQDWLRQNDLEVDVAPQEDPYEVGHPLLIAYALGLNPERFSQRGLPVQAYDEDEDMLTLRYYRARDDVQYAVITSEHVEGPWTVDGVDQEYEIDGRYVTAAIPSPENGPRFLRLLTRYEE